MSFEGSVTFNSSKAGTVRVPAGTKEVAVTFEPVFTTVPKIIASPNSFVEGPWKVRDISGTGFVIELGNEQADEVEFTWQSVLTQ